MPEKVYRLEVRYDEIDATYGGLFGGPPDAHRTMVRGIAHYYYVDDHEVTRAEYERIFQKQNNPEAQGTVDA